MKRARHTLEPPLPPWVWRAQGENRSAAEVRPIDMTARKPAESQAVLTYRMGFRDANLAGDVHGGWIMKLCDDVAVIAAGRHAQRRVVTLAVDGLLFRSPVKVSDVVTLMANVNSAWQTSMEVGVRVVAEDLHGGNVRHTLTAFLTLVALDDDGQAARVPPLISATPDEERRAREAGARRAIRLADPQELVRISSVGAASTVSGLSFSELTEASTNFGDSGRLSSRLGSEARGSLNGP